MPILYISCGGHQANYRVARDKRRQSAGPAAPPLWVIGGAPSGRQESQRRFMGVFRLIGIFLCPQSGREWLGEGFQVLLKCLFRVQRVGVLLVDCRGSRGLTPGR